VGRGLVALSLGALCEPLGDSADSYEVGAHFARASGYARQVVGSVIWPGMQSTADDLAAVAAALGPATFAAAAAAGARMHIPDALRYGLAATAEQTTSDPFPEWVSGLRPAEPVAASRPGL
jgi:hypothetical protein